MIFVRFCLKDVIKVLIFRDNMQFLQNARFSNMQKAWSQVQIWQLVVETNDMLYESPGRKPGGRFTARSN